MRLLTPPPQKRLSTRQLSTAAENIAAAQFAMYGFDVLEQGNHARYFYDLGVANAGGMLKVTVHGSFRGFWNLVDPNPNNSASAGAAYHKAIDRWIGRQGGRATYCLVQFDSCDLISTPRIYLASAADIATRLHESVDMLGDIALYEQFEVQDANGRHTVETLPEHWRFSQNRIAELMDTSEGKEALGFRFAEAAACGADQPAARVDCLPMVN
jgi:hypothetical protein